MERRVQTQRYQWKLADRGRALLILLKEHLCVSHTQANNIMARAAGLAVVVVVVAAAAILVVLGLDLGRQDREEDVGRDYDQGRRDKRGRLWERRGLQSTPELRFRRGLMGRWGNRQ